MKSDLSFKQLNNLALPALVSGVAEPLLSLTDTAIIGNIDQNATEALAAVGILGTFTPMTTRMTSLKRTPYPLVISKY